MKNSHGARKCSEVSLFSIYLEIELMEVHCPKVPKKFYVEVLHRFTLVIEIIVKKARRE
jgi:hypothetical protein